MKIFILLFVFLNLVAQDNYSLRVAYGEASSSDFGELLSGNMKSHAEDLTVLAVDGGYLLKEGLYELPVDIYLKGGLSYFDDSSVDGRNNVYEGTFYIKAYWNFDFLDNRVRVGFGEGISYTSAIIYTEYKEALDENDNNSNWLNYLDFSVDFDLGRLVTYKPLYGTYIGWAIKHRSGIYGLINDVNNGGSNYNTFYLQKNF